MDEFCLFGRALNADEIHVLSSAGKLQQDPVATLNKNRETQITTQASIQTPHENKALTPRTRHPAVGPALPGPGQAARR